MMLSHSYNGSNIDLILCTSFPVWNWGDVSYSVNKIVCLGLNPNEYIATNTDNGKNSWTTRIPAGSNVSGNWTGIASSLNGLKLAACQYNGAIYTSLDGGLSWTSRSVFGGIRNWTGLASSYDGTMLVACAFMANVFTSINAGVSWTARTSIPATKNYTAVASSPDGNKLAVGALSGEFYTSINAGVSWTARTVGPGNLTITDIAISEDGKVIIISPDGGSNPIYISTDSGTTWVAKTTSGNGPWTSVCCSFDASVIYACSYNDGIYKSLDKGDTWKKLTGYNGSGAWKIACSPYGDKLLVTTINSLYRTNSSTTSKFFAKWEINTATAGLILSTDALTYSSATGNKNVKTNFNADDTSLKYWYWETVIKSYSGLIGICAGNFTATNLGGAAGAVVYAFDGKIYSGATVVKTAASYTLDDVVGVYVDITTSTIYFYKNDNLQHTMTFSLTAPIKPCSGFNATAGGPHITNFGQNPFYYNSHGEGVYIL